MTRVTPVQVSRMRIAAQRLVPTSAGELFDDPVGVAGHLTCLQSQDWRAARLAIASRMRAPSLDAVDAAFDAGSIVRSWPMRGTLHTVLARDLRWMLALTAERMRVQTAGRHRQLGIADADLERATECARDALGGGGALTRRQLLDRWSAAGIDTAGQRGPHLLGALAVEGVLCLGPLHEGTQQFVLCDDWLRDERSPKDPIVEWARRYLTSHGPASRADFLWWTKLLVRDVAPVWDCIVDGFAAIDLDGQTLYATPQVIEAGRSRRTLAPLLTAAFDEILLGYADRSPTLPAAHANAICPGNNGMFKPVVLDGGRAVGTWARPKAADAIPRLDLFEPPGSGRLATARLAVPGR